LEAASKHPRGRSPGTSVAHCVGHGRLCIVRWVAMLSLCVCGCRAPWGCETGPTEPERYAAYPATPYYGYYPTCWQRFPDGWGCPPEPVITDLERLPTPEPVSDTDLPATSSPDTAPAPLPEPEQAIELKSPLVAPLETMPEVEHEPAEAPEAEPAADSPSDIPPAPTTDDAPQSSEEELAPLPDTAPEDTPPNLGGDPSASSSAIDRPMPAARPAAERGNLTWYTVANSVDHSQPQTAPETPVVQRLPPPQAPADAPRIDYYREDEAVAPRRAPVSLAQPVAPQRRPYRTALRLATPHGKEGATGRGTSRGTSLH
jgi:hypothetical protein